LIAEIVSDGSNLGLGAILEGQAPWDGRQDERFDAFEEMFEEGGLAGQLDQSTLLIDLGGCGRAPIVETPGGEIVLASFFRKADGEAGPDVVLAAIAKPASSEAEEIGSVEVTSGSLVIVHAPDPSHSAGALRLERPNGTYEILFDPQGDRGAHGLIEYRFFVRLVTAR
jgi:hypothetical protein